MGTRPNRDGWGSGIGFFLVSSAAALGTGIFWRVAAQANRNSQLDFWLLYLVALLLLGLPLLASDWLLGKLGRQNPLGAFRELERHSWLWQAIGLLVVAAAFFALTELAVFAAKQLAFLTRAMLGVLAYQQPLQSVEALYTELIATPAEQIFWQACFLFGLLPLASVALSIGTERLSYIAWPLAMLFLTILALHAWLGVEAKTIVVAPAPSLGFEAVIEAIVLALLSVGAGYGMQFMLASYLPIYDNLMPWLGLHVALLAVVSLFASVAVLPLHLGIAVTASDAHDLLFRVLPLVWAQTPGGQLLAILFYLALLLLAMLAALALFEVGGAFLNEELGWGRPQAMLAVALAVFAVALLLTLWPQEQRLPAGLFAQALWLITALILCVYSGWFLDQGRAQNGLGSSNLFVFAAWRWLVRLAVPLGLLLALAQSASLFNRFSL